MWLGKIGSLEFWKKRKKTDWLILGLIGAILMVVAFPIEKEEKKAEKGEENRWAEQQKMEQEDYAQTLERRLEEILSKIQGTGEVEVMVTLADDGKKVVEKDQHGKNEDETVYHREADQEAPFVRQNRYPKVEGVVVAAQGAKVAKTREMIVHSVMALFDVEAHKIVVVEMNDEKIRRN